MGCVHTRRSRELISSQQCSSTKDEADAPAPLALVAEVCARKRIAEVIDESLVREILNIELCVDDQPLHAPEFPTRREIEHAPGLDAPALEVDQIRAGHCAQRGEPVNVNLDKIVSQKESTVDRSCLQNARVAVTERAGERSPCAQARPLSRLCHILAGTTAMTLLPIIPLIFPQHVSV